MRMLILVLISVLSIHCLSAQNDRSDTRVRVSAFSKIAEALDEIEQQSRYSFIYDAKVIDLSIPLREGYEENSIYDLLNKIFKDTGIVYTIVNDQIILNRREQFIRMQQKTIGRVSGTVTDKNGDPLACVNVVEKGTTNGIITDLDGRFMLDLPEKAVIVFSYIGYNPKEIGYNGQSTIDIVLEDNMQEINEVVVTALGITKKGLSLPYANLLIGNEEMVRVKELNLMNTLSGKMAGVQIKRTSAGLGSSSRVVIRGSRSVSGNNQPLYVIDGMPILNTSNEQAWSTIGGIADAGNRDGGDGISNLNPDDIESLSVLKGASAAALYGGQASNGVILIKTRKGRVGTPRINFSSTLTVENAVSLPKFQNEYGRMEGAANSWGGHASMTAYDNVGEFFKHGITAINTLSFASGNDYHQSYFSYANTTAKGIVERNNLDKHNFNLRETTSLFQDRLKLDGSVNLVLQTVRNKSAVGGFYMNPLQGLYTFPRGMNMNPYKENFEIFSEKRNMFVQNWYTEISDFEQNPYWLINRADNIDKRTRVLSSISASLKVTDKLVLQGRANMDYIHDKFQQEIYASTSPGLAGENGRYINLNCHTSQVYGDMMAMYNNNWGAFHLNAALGASIMDTRDDMLRLDSKTASLYYPNVFTVANINMSANSYIEELNDVRRQIQSVFGMAQLGYKEMLFLDVTARNDWSSTLAFTESQNSGFFYPSVGVSWILDKTLRLPREVSFGKFRASWSKVGNDIPVFVSNRSGHLAAGGIPIPNDTAPFGALKPEMSSSIEIGTEWRFFNSRIDLDVTVYKTNTKNQLFILPSPVGAAFKNYFVNAGNIQNKGLEVSAGAVPVLTELFRWRTLVNYSFNRNKVKKLHDDLPNFTQGDEGFSSSYAMRLVEGGSFGDIYGKAFARDENGSIRYDKEGLPLEVGSGNVAKVGNNNPSFLLSWGNNLTYKDFSIYLLIDGYFGGDVLSQTQAVLDQYGVSEVSGKARDMGYVDLEGRQIQNVRAFYEQVGGRNGVTEYYMYDATNVRLRELSVAYQFPKSLLGRIGFIKEGQLSLIARNLFFIYKQSPFDPDAVLSAENKNQGVDIFGIPTTRSVGFNVKLSF